MGIRAKYVHTNLIAKDWQALANFYQKLFGCIPVPPERDLSGEKLEAGTGLSGAHLRGIHLRLPGYGDNGPTLEIFSYDHLKDRPKIAVNRPGFGHIAFSVNDVADCLSRICFHATSDTKRSSSTSFSTRARSVWLGFSCCFLISARKADLKA